MNFRAAHERYQYKPFIGSSHKWAIEKALKFSRETRVLDIGAGSGIMGKTLKDAGFKDVRAVEIDEASVEHIAPFYDSVVSTIDHYEPASFNLILLLDVLEHVTDVEHMLNGCVSLLAPGGSILISVPNVAHWSVRLPLLLGQFRYTERGVLDKTHVSFFTRRYLLNLIKQTPNLSVLELRASIEPVELVLPRFLWDNRAFHLLSRFRLGFAQVLPGLMAYQHLAVVRKTFDSRSG